MKQLLKYIQQTKNPNTQYILTTQYDTYTIVQSYTQQGDKRFYILGLEGVLSGYGGSLQTFKKTIENGECIIANSLRTLKPHPQSKVKTHLTVYYNTFNTK